MGSTEGKSMPEPGTPRPRRRLTLMEQVAVALVALVLVGVALEILRELI